MDIFGCQQYGTMRQPITTIPIRNLFPGLSTCTYLDTAARSPLNVLGKQAADQFLTSAYEGGDKKAMFECIERVRQLYAGLLQVDAAEIAITKNVSEGLNIVAHSMNWTPGDNVIVCPRIEHPNNVYVWYHAAKLYGLEVRTISADDYVVRPGEVARLIDDRTRVCAIAAQSFVPGYMTDLASLGEVCTKAGVLLVVDAAQAAGVQELDMTKLGIAAMATSTQKGLLGFYGMGFLYVRRSLAETWAPRYLARFGVRVDSGHEADLGALEQIRFAEGATRFDLGNYNFLAAAAIEPGLKLIHAVGIARIAQHTRALARRLGDELERSGLPVMGWPGGSHTGSIITVGSPSPGTAESDRLSALAGLLSKNRVKFSERRGYLRFSFHFYNNEEDVQRVCDLVSSRRNGS